MIDYDVRYTNKDGSVGAYSGRDNDNETNAKRAFLAEIKMCLRCDYEFTATVKKGDKYGKRYMVI